jgi:uncharacterized cupredoxin-like copper-binding protein
MFGTRRSILILAMVGLALPACGGNGGGDNGGVAVTLRDFEITLAQDTLPAGTVSFDIRNEGPSVHEFVVFRTDLAADALPTNDAGEVDEEGEGVELVDEVEDIAVDATATLDVDLDPGSYVAVCNLPGHYAQGMATGFTVE